jgi:hypothetical protein
LAKIDASEIVTKSVEISKSLVNTSTGMHDFDLKVTRAIGDIARFAITIKGARVIDSEQQLAAISSAMKIDYRITTGEILPSLDRLGWTESQRDGSRIVRVHEKVPPIEDVLKALGQEWNDKQPGKIDEASVKALSLLCSKPWESDAIQSELSLSAEDFDILLGYGTTAAYLGSFRSRETKKDVIWTPLYWLGKSEIVEKYLAKQSSQTYQKLAHLHTDIKRFQGMPVEMLQSRDLVESSIRSGFFPSVQVADRSGRAFEYVFTAAPQFEPDARKDVFERARLIVACIRHGQHHAEVTKILYPLSILRAMRENRLSPHSYAGVQYIILKLHNVIDLEPVTMHYGDAYKVRWIDTPENKIAADIAELMLSGHDASIGSAKEVEAATALAQGVYSYTSEQRMIRAKRGISARREFDRVMETIAGVRR